MSDYYRPRVPGAYVFFTVNLAERGLDLLVQRIDLLRAAVSATLAERPFEIAAWVVRPDHMHAIWRMPEGDADYSVHLRYCHMNSVKHGYADNPEDWLFSSVHREIREGRFEAA